MSDPSSSFITLENSIPADFGSLTYSITDGMQQTVPLTVPANGTVLFPTDPANAPWNIVATLNGPQPTCPTVMGVVAQFDKNAIVNASLTLAWPGASASSAPVPPSTQSGLAPPVKSLLDPANWQPLVAPSPAPAPVPPADTPKSLKLVFYMQMQTKSQWCWAAVASSVAAYYPAARPPILSTQCALANWAFNQNNCCVDNDPAHFATPSACNQPYQPEAALAYVKCFNAMSNARLLFSEIVTEIVGGRPIIIRVTWQGTGGAVAVGHALGMVGYDATDPDPDNATVDLKDPTFGETAVTVKGFPANYHGGLAWTHTFRTQAPQ